MSEQPTAQKKSHGWLKAGIVGLLGLGGGAAGTYATAVVDRVVKPPRPIANFSVAAEGLAVTCQNHATGESGWWDFGDGSALEPFAPDAPVTHTYAKPGNYTVKLTVRNYLSDENERSVPVEVAAAAARDSAAPQIAGFAVTPVGTGSVAPATFRVTADVTNADGCVWDFGDGRVEAGDGGKIDRMVTFDKPGTFAVQFYAHGGKLAVKQTATVKVDAAQTGTLMAVLKVTDTGSRLHQSSRTEAVAVAAPVGKNPSPSFSKVVQARPGCTITDAAPISPAVAGVRNLRVTVAADRRSATLSGDWADGKPKGASGADVIVPLKLTEERTVALPPAVTVVTGTMSWAAGSGRCELPLPPPVPGLSREYQIEIRQTAASGQAVAVARGPADGRGSVSFPWAAPSGAFRFGATLEGDKVVVIGGAAR
jgi:PKD repeat protein